MREQGEGVYEGLDIIDEAEAGRRLERAFKKIKKRKKTEVPCSVCQMGWAKEHLSSDNICPVCRATKK